MAASPVTSNTFAFADGGSGHVCSFGSAPAVGQEDVLFVNSDTTVTTPAGFAAATNVSNQGVYSFRRLASGGESSSVTITTAGNFNAEVHWSRWDNVIAADDAAATRVEDGGGSATPSHTTGTLAATGELMLAFAALHDIGLADQAGPAWSSGYTPLTAAIQGTGGTGVAGFVAYRVDAGTAPETPSVSWSGSACKDRVMMTLSFTAGGGTSASAQATAVTATANDATATIGPAAQGTNVTVAANDASGTVAPSAGLTAVTVAALDAQATIAAAAALAAVTTTAGDAIASVLASAECATVTAAAVDVGFAAATLAQAGCAVVTVAAFQEAAGSIIRRPNSGTTSRPDSGRIIRPNTGTITRP